MTIELTLPDMTCGHCVKTVTEVVQQLDPNARVQADVAHHKVTVETTTPAATLKAALAEEGYPASN